MTTAQRPKILASKLLASSWRLKVFEDKLQYAHGKPFSYARIEVPDSVVIIAIRKSDQKLLLVRQYRHGAKDYFWEFPAGYFEDGESAIVCAKREFEEETGFELLKPKELFAASLQPSRSNQIIHLVIGLVGKQNAPKRDIYEEMSVKFFTKRGASRAIARRASISHMLALEVLQDKSGKHWINRRHIPLEKAIWNRSAPLWLVKCLA